MASATTLRTHTCGELRLQDTDKKVTITGWVQVTRDFGNFIFVDVRDRHGMTQISIDSEASPKLYQTAKKLGREFVISVTGIVKERENKNPKLATGDIEIVPQNIEILNSAILPPFKIENETDGGEDLRMVYRYLDLRRPMMAERLVLRAKMVKAIRQYLDTNGFLEIETPFLIKSTPEGARDFVVPSRLHKGTFYALPQSPQILKQLLMVGGMDRYYQIVKCFRDEDFRGDRQPEFTQVDCEMSFVGQEDVLQMFEGMTKHVFKTIKEIELPDFKRITYAEALEKYGSDKPDLRFEMPLVNLTEIVQDIEFPVFQESIQQNGKVLAINIVGASTWSRKQTDSLTDFVKDRGLKGLITLHWIAENEFKCSAQKFLSEEQIRHILDTAEAKVGDLVLIGAGVTSKVRKAMGDLRLEVAKRNNLIPENAWSVFWVVDFPLFEADEETGETVPVHHPFVMPHPEDWENLEKNPLNVRALCYDLVMNGNEIVSGSVRIHRKDIQDKIFHLLHLSEEEIQNKFGFLLKAFEYGAPPHAGCAFGLDRWVMLFAQGQTIRDVIAFPKNSGGKDVMLDAPSIVDEKALSDVHIALRKD